MRCCVVLVVCFVVVFVCFCCCFAFVWDANVISHVISFWLFFFSIFLTPTVADSSIYGME